MADKLASLKQLNGQLNAEIRNDRRSGCAVECRSPGLQKAGLDCQINYLRKQEIDGQRRSTVGLSTTLEYSD